MGLVGPVQENFGRKEKKNKNPKFCNKGPEILKITGIITQKRKFCKKKKKGPLDC